MKQLVDWLSNPHFFFTWFQTSVTTVNFIFLFIEFMDSPGRVFSLIEGVSLMSDKNRELNRWKDKKKIDVQLKKMSLN